MKPISQNQPARAEFEKILPAERQSFLWKHITRRQFTAPYHYHPEFELIHIRRGLGRRLVGASISHFSPNDLVFIAPNVPHIWQVAPGCRQAETFYVQFKPEFVGTEFFRLPEMQSVAKMMEAARSGVTFSAHIREEMTVRFRKFPTLTAAERLFELLDILYCLSRDPGMRTLGNAMDSARLNRKQEDRISKVFQYINENLEGSTSQATIARSVNLSSSAFSRLFKQTTGKCFMEVVTELRIAQVCRLLAETDHTISQIAYKCGFETLSHFNSQFRAIMKTTPRKYRRNLGNIRKKNLNLSTNVS
jgi:AraC-like DNA-binding protein